MMMMMMVVVFNDDDFILKTHAPASSWRCWFRPTHGWTPIAPIHDVISMCAHHVISYHVRQKSHFLWPSFALRKTKTWLTTRHPSKGLVLGLFSQHGRKWAIPSGKGSSKKNWKNLGLSPSFFVLKTSRNAMKHMIYHLEWGELLYLTISWCYDSKKTPWIRSFKVTFRVLNVPLGGGGEGD